MVGKPIIALDLDGTILNYGWKAPEPIQVNTALIRRLPEDCDIAIVTNQGGIPFSYNSEKFISPHNFYLRLLSAVDSLESAGRTIVSAHVSLYHQKAKTELIARAYEELLMLTSELSFDVFLHVEPTSRKPHKDMLVESGASIFYGDGEEDRLCAEAAGTGFALVSPAFVGGVA